MTDFLTSEILSFLEDFRELAETGLADAVTAAIDFAAETVKTAWTYTLLAVVSLIRLFQH